MENFLVPVENIKREDERFYLKSIQYLLLTLTNVTFINCLGNDSNIAVRGDWFTKKKNG